jgi:tetratricopeptide (TPR) repeat protein
MKFYYFVIFSLISLSTVGQSLDYGNSTDATKLCIAVQSNGFMTNEKADDALKKILSVIGASKRFVVKSCNNIENAVAVTYKGNRYILYDSKFMDEIASKTNYWSNIFILSHEVGHHINGHSVDIILHLTDSVEPISLSQSRQQELEADEFAGFILAKLGANLSQASSAINLLANNDDDSFSTHPSKNKRLNAIKIGFDKGIAYNKDYDKKTNINKAEECYYRGIEKVDLEDYKGAIIDFSIAIELNPKSEYYCARGITKTTLNDITGAMADLNKAIELNSNNSDAYCNRGNTKARLKDDIGALADYSKAISLNPNDGELYFNRGIIKNVLKEYDGAIVDFTKAINMNTNLDLAYLHRGNSKYLLKDYQGSITDYSKTIQLNPNNAKSYYLRGKSKFSLEQKDSACLDWSKAAELGYVKAQEMIKKSCN